MGTIIVNPYQELWTPQYISTDLWLDANDSSTITLSSSAVSEWRDKSGNNRHATQVTAGNRPILTTVNNKQYLAFDTTKSLSLSCPQLLPSTIFFVIRVPSSLGSSYRIFLNRNLSAPALYLSLSNGEFGCYWNFNYPSGINLRNKNTIVSSELTSTTVTNRVLPNTAVTLAHGQSSIFSWVSINSTIVQQSIFDLAEIIIFNSAVSQANRELVEGYLAHKWNLTNNLPIDHPYKNIPPYA